MRLLKRENTSWFSLSVSGFSLTEFAGSETPNYAILSHTWGKKEEEVTFEDILKGTGKSKVGYEKLRFCATQAARNGLLYFWLDTCCINRANSSELQEAINSMFRWYSGATRCYVYLSDVPSPESGRDRQLLQAEWELAFHESRWFTRGWTLQELIAPQSVEFFSREAKRLGDKKSLGQQINKITGIDLEAFQGKPVSAFSVDERMSWAKKRKTTREEDIAYSLLGIFDVHMPLIYGEGDKKALARLQKEIQDSLDSLSLSSNIVESLSSFPYARCNLFKPFTLSMNDAPVDLLSTNFIGRERELALIRNAHATEESSPTRCVVWGIRGVGKSQLALRYTKVFLESTELSVVFWMSASSVEKLYQGFSRLLNLVNHPDQLTLEQNARLVAARRWMEQPEISGISCWLLVLDDVEIATLEFLRENLPRQCKKGRILITTRVEPVARAICRASGKMHLSFELETPSVEDSAKLFLDLAGVGEDSLSDSSRSQVTDLVKHLGRLPFAVNQAASFMVQSYQTIESFLKLYQSKERYRVSPLPLSGSNPLQKITARYIQIFDWQDPLSVYESKSISAIFASHLRDLRRLSPDVLNLLQVLVYFDPGNISIEMIQAGASNLLNASESPGSHSNNNVTHSWREWSAMFMSETMRFKPQRSIKNFMAHLLDLEDKLQKPPSSELDSLTTLMSSDVQLQNALHQLQMLSFVKRRSASEGGAVCIHDLTQTLVQQFLSSEGSQTNWFKVAVRIACGALNLVQNPASPENWHHCENVVLHILSLTKYSESVDDTILELLIAKRKIAAYWCARGRYHEAIKSYQQILALDGNQLRNEDFDELQMKTDLAEAYWHAGVYNESKLLYEEVLRIRESQLGNHQPATLSISESIAMVCRSQGQDAEAASIFERVLAIRKTNLGQGHPDTVRTIDNLALVLGQQGRYLEAETLYKQALVQREELLGADHIDTLYTVNNLANNFRDQGRYSEALVLLERSFEGRKSQLGDDHPSTLYTLADIAKIFSHQGRLPEAEKLYEQALAGNERMLGHYHQETLWVVNCLANLYHLQRRNEEATKMYHRALYGREEYLGRDHPNTMRTVHGLANLYRDQKEFLRSEKLYERLLRDRRAKLRSGHPETLQTYCDMAQLSISMHRSHEAEQYYRKALKEGIEELGHLHPDTIKMRETLLSFLKDQESQHRSAGSEGGGTVSTITQGL